MHKQPLPPRLRENELCVVVCVSNARIQETEVEDEKYRMPTRVSSGGGEGGRERGRD